LQIYQGGFSKTKMTGFVEFEGEKKKEEEEAI